MRSSGSVLVWILACTTFVAHAAKTVTYYYSDPQGTPLAETDAAGNVIDEEQKAWEEKERIRREMSPRNDRPQ